MPKTDIKKYLKSLTKDEIIEVVLALYSTSKEAKNLLEYAVNPNPEEKLAEYKAILSNEFYPKRGMPKCRLSVCRKAINDFKKLNVNSPLFAELLIFHAELGARFTADYGDMDEAYYTSFENHFARTCEFLHKNNLIERYEERLLQILKLTEDCGWGFHDTLCQICSEYLDNDSL